MNDIKNDPRINVNENGFVTVNCRLCGEEYEVLPTIAKQMLDYGYSYECLDCKRMLRLFGR